MIGWLDAWLERLRSSLESWLRCRRARSLSRRYAAEGRPSPNLRAFQETRKAAIPADACAKATRWWSDHDAHVRRLLKSEGAIAYPPTGSDVYRPELWRPPHWRWFERTSH